MFQSPVFQLLSCPLLFQKKRAATVWNQWLLFQSFVPWIQPPCRTGTVLSQLQLLWFLFFKDGGTGTGPAIQELSCLSSNCCDFYFSRTVALAAKFNKFREWSHMRFRAGAKARITRQAKRNMQRRNIDADKSLHKSNTQRSETRKKEWKFRKI